MLLFPLDRWQVATAECSRHWLYQAIQAKIAARASARVREWARSTSSTLREANQASATALSRHEPVRPMERRSPSRAQASMHAVEVYSLGAAVGVEDGAVQTLQAAGGHGGVQGAHDQGSVVMGAHRVAQQMPGGKVEHRARYSQPSSVGM